MLQVPFVKGMVFRGVVEHAGQRLLGPDNCVLRIEGRLMAGHFFLTEAIAIGLSDLDEATLPTHPNYANWLSTHIYAGGGKASTHGRIHNFNSIKQVDAHVNATVDYAPGLDTRPMDRNHDIGIPGEAGRAKGKKKVKAEIVPDVKPVVKRKNKSEIKPKKKAKTHESRAVMGGHVVQQSDDEENDKGKGG